MEVIATTKFTRCVPYFQTGNTFMILKYDIKSVRSGLHIANSPTLHKNKKKLKKKENRKNQKKKKKKSITNWLAEISLSRSTWFPMVTYQMASKWWLFLLDTTDWLWLLYRFIYSGLWCACPTLVTSRSSLLWLEAAAAKDKSTGVISVRGQHIKLIPTCKSGTAVNGCVSNPFSYWELLLWTH